MFVIMSKKAAAQIRPPNNNVAVLAAARTQNACDTCRIRKAKCDGHTPCGRCRTRQLVCTTSRKQTGPTGPVTAEHLATLQEQQRRLTQAIFSMAHVIKHAEALGFVDDDNKNAAPELSSAELGDVLQRFAPDDAASNPATSFASNPDSSSKKRKLESSAILDANMDIDAVMGQCQDATTSANQKDYQRFEKFIATFQQHRSNGPALLPTTAPQVSRGIGPQLSETSMNPQEMPFLTPVGSSAFDLPPQLGPFMDLVDWDASLEHLLEIQQHGGSDFDWDPNGMVDGDFGYHDATS